MHFKGRSALDGLGSSRLFGAAREGTPELGLIRVLLLQYRDLTVKREASVACGWGRT